jgi:predicted Zn-dependent protease
MNNNLGILRLLPVLIGFVIVGGLLLRGCHKGPLGRNQLILTTPEQELQLGRQAYQQILAKSQVVERDPVVDSVREVGERLRKASEDPAVRKRLGLRGDAIMEWEFKVIRSDKINAFCLPGGKVAVYTGILPVAKTKAGLAVVLGHEIGHALARHGGERISQEEAFGIIQTAVATSLGGLDPHKQQMVLGMLGAGAQFGVLLPFSRSHESEADHIGIILMAAAGYDPNTASEFWQEMTRRAGKSGPEFASTHPSHETRIADLRKWAAEEAMQVYNSASKAPNGPLGEPTTRPVEKPRSKSKSGVLYKGEGVEIK